MTERIVARGAMNVQSLSNAANTVTDTTVFPNAQGFPTSGDGVTTNTNEITGMLYNVELGAQYNIGDIENLEVFVGVSVVFGLDGKRQTYNRQD